MADWPTIASLATAAGTLVLAGATFASVRSANRAARVAERSLLAGLRPLIVPSRAEDATLKAVWQEDYKVVLAGGRGAAEEADAAIYHPASVRNSVAGIAFLHSWYRIAFADDPHIPPAPADQFRRLTRDL